MGPEGPEGPKVNIELFYSCVQKIQINNFRDLKAQEERLDPQDLQGK
jgi:hypothetical protein